MPSIAPAAPTAPPRGAAVAVPPAQRLRRDTLLLLTAHLTFWTLGAIALLPGLDRFADMHELYAWGIAPQWGTYKHPPLLSWIVGAWFLLFPTWDAAFHLLAMALATLSVWLTGRFTAALLADDPRAQEWSLWAMAAAAFALPYGNLALKLNMNSILMPLWPLTGWAWVHSVRRPGWASAAALGAAGALAMLGKYYSGVLLVSLLLATLACVPGRAWLRTRWPWVATGAFVLVLLPHLVWVAQHDWITFRYVEHRDGGFGLADTLKFCAYTAGIWCVAALALGWAGRPWRADASLVRWRGAALALALGPWAVTLALALGMNIDLTSPWALPLGFAFPAAVLGWARPQADWASMRRRVIGLLLLFWALTLAGAAVVQWQSAHRGDGRDGYYLPRAELARAVAASGPAPAWIGGDWQYASALSFYLPTHPNAMPGFPDEGPAAVHTPAGWQRAPGLLVCPRLRTEMSTFADCSADARAWLARHGLAVQASPVRVQRSGWRFPLARPLDFELFRVAPAMQAPASTAGPRPGG